MLINEIKRLDALCAVFSCSPFLSLCPCVSLNVAVVVDFLAVFFCLSFRLAFIFYTFEKSVFPSPADQIISHLNYTIDLLRLQSIKRPE